MLNVVGIYGTSFDAMKAIDTLKHDGIDDRHIHVVVNDELKSRTIEDKSRAIVKDVQTNDVEHDNFWEELKSFFTDQDLNIGKTEAEAERYSKEVENGQILVLVGSNADQGRSRLLSTENIPVNETVSLKVHGEKVDNQMTGDRFNQEDHTPQAKKPGYPSYATKSNPDLLQQSGRPKVREESMTSLAGRQKEYEEEINPFENRYLPDKNRSSDLRDDGNSLS
ncbi:general stress protein [Siminovitchia sediminis]|uniref:General stress protein n=1 Tax=Siminovitchia sediminis TaxID=1274353 RepID=A0ABW4KC07_9BACI